ncbi:MAG TPA: hypothetical protein VJT31_28065 [Rugosimonospora sp.]|nr:hypothetical protein [Rugosimonospora sp.]
MTDDAARGAQTWSMDGPPGPEVTAVRDRFGVRWRRDGDLWWGDIGHGYEDYRQWHEVLSRGPLTDASGDNP